MPVEPSAWAALARRGGALSPLLAPTARRRPAPPSSLFGGVRALGAAAVLVLALAAAMGWLYVLRGLGAFDAGPRIPDALPLLGLAGQDGQALLRVILAWGSGGLLAGMALRSLGRRPRGALALLTGLVVLALSSEASYAVAHTLSLGHVIATRLPGSGVAVEAVIFALGCLALRTRARPG